MQNDLVIDLGMHDGADTAFYLRKGFRVVAVEANPLLAAAGEERFRSEIAAGRLRIVNKAIAAAPGRVSLYVNENSLWSSLSKDRIDEYQLRFGVSSAAIEVEAITCDQLLRETGTPYYLKIDIEGLDTTALASLRALDERPSFVSFEAERRDMQTVREETNLLVSLGYDRFKIVPQHLVYRQKEPDPPREGGEGGRPLHDSSGLFGRDLPGRWLTASEAIDAYRRPLLNHYLTGSDSVLKSKWLRACLKRVGFRGGWYDTHAKRAGLPD